jgi:hypothetical protein
MQLFDNNPIAQKFVLNVANVTPVVAARQLIDWQINTKYKRLKINI